MRISSEFKTLSQTQVIKITESNHELYKQAVLAWLEEDFTNKTLSVEQMELVSRSDTYDLVTGAPKNHFWHNREIISESFERLAAMVVLNTRQEVIAYMIWIVNDLYLEIAIIEVKATYHEKGVAKQMLNTLAKDCGSAFVFTGHPLPQSESFFASLNCKVAVDVNRTKKYFKSLSQETQPQTELPLGCVIAVCPHDCYKVFNNLAEYQTEMKYFQVSVNSSGKLVKPIVTACKNDDYIAVYYNQKLITFGRAKNLFHNGRAMCMSGAVLGMAEFKPLEPQLFYGTGFLTQSIAIQADITVEEVDADLLFSKRQPSALKITDIAHNTAILNKYMRLGWRWVSANWMSRDNPVQNSYTIPTLSLHDWVITEGKTLRLIRSMSTSIEDIAIKRMLAVKERLYYLAGDNNNEVYADTSMNKASQIGNSSYCAVGVGLLNGEFGNSYARLAGAYLRHLDRLPKLRAIFPQFFLEESIKREISVTLYGATNKKYSSIKKLTLNSTIITFDNLHLIAQAVGIPIASLTSHAKLTIENTIPLKKVLEVLTVYNSTQKNKNTVIEPWLVSIKIFNQQVEFLLSENIHSPSQLMVSMEKGSGEFVGNAYPFWFCSEKFSAAVVDQTLSSSIARSTQDVKNIKELIEFIVCTQVVEAHCNVSSLDDSRVPGTGKLARSMIKHCSNNLLGTLFNISKTGNNNMFYPMAGTDGTGNGRNAVNRLIRNSIFENKYTKNVRGGNNASCTNMSDDSEADEALQPVSAAAAFAQPTHK